MIFTREDIPIARDYVRVVHGQRGSYVEFSVDQMNPDRLSIPMNTEWRIFSRDAYYVEYRCGSVKVYFQKREVKYADYKIGMYYVAVKDIRELKDEDEQKENSTRKEGSGLQVRG